MASKRIRTTLTRKEIIANIEHRKFLKQKASLVKEFILELDKQPRRSYTLNKAQRENPAAKVFHAKANGAIFLQERNNKGHCLGKRISVSI